MRKPVFVKNRGGVDRLLWGKIKRLQAARWLPAGAELGQFMRPSLLLSRIR